MKKNRLFASLIIALTICLFASRSAQAEVWYCGDFNIQGPTSNQFIQFYPFGAKIADLYKIDNRTQILAVSPSATGSGSMFGYIAYRTDSAPIIWFYLDANGNLVNWTILFATCGYNP